MASAGGRRSFDEHDGACNERLELRKIAYEHRDGEHVVAVIRDNSRPLVPDEVGAIKPGAIVGAALEAHIRQPTWLCELLCWESGAEQQALVVVKCVLAQAVAAQWYCPPCEGEGMAASGPADYDVFGVLPKEMQGPPVAIDAKYLRVSRPLAFVPPPYRRGSTWYMERAIFESL